MHKPCGKVAQVTSAKIKNDDAHQSTGPIIMLHRVRIDDARLGEATGIHVPYGQCKECRVKYVIDQPSEFYSLSPGKPYMRCPAGAGNLGEVVADHASHWTPNLPITPSILLSQDLRCGESRAAHRAVTE